MPQKRRVKILMPEGRGHTLNLSQGKTRSCGLFPSGCHCTPDQSQTARCLECRYPEDIFKYCLSGPGNLKTNAPRKEYARQAQVMSKIHRVLVDVLGDAPRWCDFALKVKQDNITRPAFQEEFAKVVPGRREPK
jgi:hypothetical protein